MANNEAYEVLYEVYFPVCDMGEDVRALLYVQRSDDGDCAFEYTFFDEDTKDAIDGGVIGEGPEAEDWSLEEAAEEVCNLAMSSVEDWQRNTGSYTMRLADLESVRDELDL